MQRSSYAVVVAAFFLGLLFATFILLYGLDYFLKPPLTYIAFSVLTITMVPLFYLLLQRLLLPSLVKVTLWQRLLLVTLMAGAGAYIWWQNPIKPINELTAILPNVSLAAAIGWLLMLLLGGLFLLSLLLLVIKLEANAPHRFYIGAGLFVLYLMVGVSMYDDYSLSPDARLQQQHGQVAMAYLAPAAFGHLSDEPLQMYVNRYYGVAQHLPLVLLEEANQLSPPLDFQLRNYVTFLLCSLGVLAMYRLGKDSHSDWRYGLASASLYLLFPRLFVHSLYNIKDPLFAAMFAVALYFGFRYWRSKQWTYGLLFAVTVAFATTIRFIALGLLAVVMVVVCFDFVMQQSRQSILGYASLPVLLLVFYGAYIVMSPAAYGTPFTYLFDTIVFFSDYQGWDKEMMYLGLWTVGRNPPWHYIPVWMTITLPIGTLLLAVIGGLRMGVDVLQARWRILQSTKREPLIYFGLLTVPIVAGIIQGSTLYNGWRQLYFVFVPLVSIATYGLASVYAVLQNTKSTSKIQNSLSAAVTVMFIVGQLNLIRWMVVNHPHQSVYFNPIVELEAFGGRAEFERDYWRLSTRQGVEYILENDPRDVITVAPHIQVSDALTMTDHPEKDRIQAADLADPNVDYFIQTYRWPWEIVERPAVYTVYVDGLAIMSVERIEATAETD